MIHCYCGGELRITDSRKRAGYVKRRRICTDCGARRSTVEVEIAVGDELRISRPHTRVIHVAGKSDWLRREGWSA